MTTPYIITPDEAGKLFPNFYTVEDDNGLTAHTHDGRVFALNVPLCEYCDAPVLAGGFCPSCDLPLTERLAA